MTIFTEEDRLERIWKRQVPAWVISGGMHLTIMLVFLYVAWRTPPVEVEPPEMGPVIVKAEEPPEEKRNFDNEDVGLDPTKQLNYNVDRKENVSVPGILRPEEAVGIDGAPPAAAQNVSPPPGIGGGAGGGLADGPATGNMFGDAGGYLGGRLIPGQMFGGRSGASREKMVAEGGGNPASEAAVAKGLKWLQRQQKADGHWQMVEGNMPDDFGTTGLALLPFLAAGVTHKPNPSEKQYAEYVKTVDLGLKWLMKNQTSGNGLLGGRTSHKHYGHAICTVVLCEAYGMTNDPSLKKAAQRGIDYLVKAQHSAGGFRYEIAQPGDTSVTGWCLQALQSGKLAGLNVPAEVLYKVSNFLDTTQTQNGAAYGYTGPGGTPNMTAVGLLCRAYLGWGPKNPNMMAGVENLKKNLPDKKVKNIYYYYYATQVMHFCSTPDDWLKNWNPKIRDLLVDTQDNSTGANRGSWAPDTSFTGTAGGRMAATSLSLLTLEVYYRHLPLYKRDTSGLKELE